MTQQIDIAALRKAAYRATPGPWEVQTGCSWRRIGTAHGHHRRDGDVLAPTVSAADGHPDISAPAGNLEYIAAANPAVILALLDRLELAERDTELLDWLADPDNHDGDVRLPAKCVEQNLHSMRDAIRAAMQGEGA